ncbi:kinesin-like protein KIF16B isoform X2 [Amphiura filiformis]|uniref:kinesin-like protein KIF16B isoform X2 n=1 Tax=Amphiura filiformis TaxID=82378 RepID=UPI003B2167C1
MASVKVAVRVRPINKREINMGSTCIISMEGKKTSITNLKIPATAQNNLAIHSPGENIGRERVKTFSYDYSYWSVNATDRNFASQDKVFRDLGQDVLKSAFEGYNACIFAYGQTGSGKSYTMMGQSDCQGLIPKICQGLYAKVKSDEDEGVSYRTEVSYLEIYCERVRDLLRNSKDHTLKVREHPRDGPYVQGLSKHLVSDYADIKALMDRGNNQRTTASTNMNDTSSRSHAIFTISFTQAKFKEDMPSETVSKINLVDLAGSERADATGATGNRLKEGANINKSLVTLGNVISALADCASSAMSPATGMPKRKPLFIPYRDSVLTWLLKDSLGGNSKTIMVATISPADVNYGETLSTLRYANRAKNIINKPTINEDPNVKLIRELRAEIARLKSHLGGGMDIPNNIDRDKLLENEEKLRMLTEEWNTKWRETQRLMKDRTLALRTEGSGVVLDSDLPHLIGVDDDLLSTGLVMYHIKEGKTSIGHHDAENKCDIVLSGADLEDFHCWLNYIDGNVTLHPRNKSMCAVNGKVIDKPAKLTQGCVVSIGQYNQFRFNNPAEAKRLKHELKSKSMTDLSKFKSTENLLSQSLFYSYTLEMQKKHQEEWEQLEKKRKEIDDMETKHKEAEEARLREQEAMEVEITHHKEQLTQLKEEREQAQQRATDAESKLQIERKRLHRQSLDVLRQLEEYKQQKQTQCQENERKVQELEEEKEKLQRILSEKEEKLTVEKQKLGAELNEERKILQEMEARQAERKKEIERTLQEERSRLEGRLKEQRLRFEAEMKQIEEREAVMDDALNKANEELTKTKAMLQRERDEERHFVEVEREKLEALKTKHDLARRLSSEMEESVRKQLARENHEVAKARDDFERLKQTQLDAIQEAEKTIQTKAESMVADVWESRTKLENEKKEAEDKDRRIKRAMFAAKSEEARAVLSKEADEVQLEIKRIKQETEALDKKEQEVEKVIESEFVALEQRKKDDDEHLEAEWSKLMQMEAANLQFIEQEMIESATSFEKQKEKLTGTETKLKEFQHQQKFALKKAEEERVKVKEEKSELQGRIKVEEGKIKKSLDFLQKQQRQIEKGIMPDGQVLERQRSKVKALEAKRDTMVQKIQEELNLDTLQLEKLVAAIAGQKVELEDLLQTESFVEGKFKDEQKQLNHKIRNGMNPERLQELTPETLTILEEKTQQQEIDLKRQREEFEKERQLELERIESEKNKLKELENQERINALVEEQVKKRLFEEQMAREKALRLKQEMEARDRAKQLQQIQVAHNKEMEQLRKKFAETRRNSFGTHSIGSQSSLDSCLFPRRRFTSLEGARTPHTSEIKDPIKIAIPSYMERGRGWDTHHVFEIQISVLNESWIVYRRYSKFRELHDYMRIKYKEIGALDFPPKRLFGNKSEKVVAKRRTDLEIYLKNFIAVCLKLPQCPLSPGPDRDISKKVLCDFSPFFRKGAFETSKYSTS